MKAQESFGGCLQRVLAEEGMSASEAARLVGFRSRNSIFRILAGDTSSEVDGRFLAALRQAVGDRWPQRHWDALDTALNIKRVGLQQYRSDQAFRQAMHGTAQTAELTVETRWHARPEELPLAALLEEISAGSELLVIMTGCCQREVTTVLVQAFGRAGEEGRVTIRHYIDIREEDVVHNILGVLPLLSKVWYNARLVEEDSCGPEMEAIYRTNVISIRQHRSDGQDVWHELVQYDAARFVHRFTRENEGQMADVLDRQRFQLELLKPLTKPDSGADAFVDYTSQYAWLEKDGMILSIKPDVHFNCIPSDVLYPAILDGFRQAGLAVGEELTGLVEQLKVIHDARYENMWKKHRPTHLVYSIPAMERFMRTGVLTDQFFIQRAYTPEERRRILCELYRQTQQNPYFHIHFLREDVQELRHEMTFYEDKGVLLLDAYTGYDLHDDHSEALITLPAFMENFYRFFMDQLLGRLVLPKAEGLAVLERLYTDMET